MMRMLEQGPAPQPDDGWTQKARDFAEARQQSAFFKLGDQLGLGSDPLEIQRKMFRSVAPPSDQQLHFLASQPGYDAMTPDELRRFGEKVKQSYLDDQQIKMPTPFEDPLRYPVIIKTFRNVYNSMCRDGRAIGRRPLMATLPLGDINALIEDVPGDETRILFFDQGLFQFLVNFSAVVSWAIPPLGHEQLSDDRRMARLPNRHTMPAQASMFFAAALRAYILSGSPVAEPSGIPTPPFNHYTSVTLNVQMLRFVIAHELRHAELGDSAVYGDIQANWNREYDADAMAASLVVEMAQREQLSGAVACWACDLVVTIFHLLYRGMGITQFGGDHLRWQNPDHPDPLSRRVNLRGKAGNGTLFGTSQEPIGAFGQLCGMSDSLLNNLWQMSLPPTILAHKQGLRPSPIWTKDLKRSITDLNKH